MKMSYDPKTCEKCKFVEKSISLENLILARDEHPTFDHVHMEDGKLVAFNAEARKRRARK